MSLQNILFLEVGWMEVKEYGEREERDMCLAYGGLQLAMCVSYKVCQYVRYWPWLLVRTTACNTVSQSLSLICRCDCVTVTSCISLD